MERLAEGNNRYGYFAKIVSEQTREKSCQCKAFPLKQTFRLAVVATSRSAIHRLFCRLSHSEFEKLEGSLWQYSLILSQCPGASSKSLHLIEWPPDTTIDLPPAPSLWIEVKEYDKPLQSVFPSTSSLMYLTETLYGTYIAKGDSLPQGSLAYELFLVVYQLLADRELMYTLPSTSTSTYMEGEEDAYSLDSAFVTIRHGDVPPS